MKKQLIFLIITCCCNYFLPPFGGIKGGSSQPLFQKTWGGPLLDQANDIIATNDGNFVIVGNTFNSNLNCDNILLMKIDNMGDTLWARVYGLSGGQRGINVIQTNDGGYAFTGIGGGFIPGDTSGGDIILGKTDTDGNLLWTKVFGGTGYEEPIKIIQTPDSGYLICGNTESFGYINPDICDKNSAFFCPKSYLIRIKPDGDTLWTRIITNRNGGENFIKSITPLTDGGFLLCGRNNISSVGGDYSYMIKIDTAGNITWLKQFKYKIEEVVDAIEKEDGSLILMGNGWWDYSNFMYTQGVTIAETDSAGNLIRVKITDDGNDTTTMGVSGSEFFELANQDYLISTLTNYYGGGGGIIFIDNSYNIVSSKVYSGSIYEGFVYDGPSQLAQINNNSFFSCGYARSFGKGNYDIYIVNFDSLGNSACNTYDINLTMKDIPVSDITQIDTGFVVGNTNTIVIDYPLQQGYPQLEMMDCSDWVGIATLSPPEGGRWVSIYPNPNGGRFEITITPTKYEQILRKYEVRIMNIFGQCVFQSAIYNPQSAMLKVDMSGEAAGIYFVEVRADNGEIERARVAVVK